MSLTNYICFLADYFQYEMMRLFVGLEVNWIYLCVSQIRLQKILREIITMLREQLPGCSSKKRVRVVVEVFFSVTKQSHYEMGQLLGQGTFGKVFSAKDLRTGEIVAIKQVFQDKRFKNRELQIISRLDNHNIIYMKDYYFVNRKEDQYLYIVMDFYQSNLQLYLREHRKNKKNVDPGVRKVLAFQLFKALYYLQKNNVCHRDLKPPNILINPQTFELKICDFGSAKIFQKSEKNVAYICSRYYRAPELIFEYCLYRTEVDVWSAGCILAQLLTRQPIFPGDSALEQLIEVMKIIGTPSKQYLIRYSPQANELLNLPVIPSAGWQRVLKKFSPEPEFIDLLEKIMVYDITKRYTPFQILKHQYFHDLPSQKYHHLVQKLPHIFQFTKLHNKENGKEIWELEKLYLLSNKQCKLSMNNNDSECYKLETSDSSPESYGQEFGNVKETL